MKTAEDLLIEIDRLHGDDTVNSTKEEIIEIMQEYAEQFIDLAAEKASTCYDPETDTGSMYDFLVVDKQSILKLKELLK